MDANLVNLAIEVLTPVSVAVSGTVVTFLAHHVGLVRIKKAQALLTVHNQVAQDAVKLVQQIYKDSSGDEKLRVASKIVADKLQSMKIPVSPDAITGLVESAVKTLKKDFGDAWNQEVNTTPTPTPTTTTVDPTAGNVSVDGSSAGETGGSSSAPKTNTPN